MPDYRDFIDLMHERGLLAPSTLNDDGQIHRCATQEKPNGKDASYCLHGADQPPWGWVVNFREGEKATRWSERSVDKYSAEQRKESAQARRFADQAVQEHVAAIQAEAASHAESTWREASEASPDHPYLVRKRILAHGVRSLNGALLVPMFRKFGEPLCGYQKIQPDGTKRFLTGSQKKGSFFVIGKPEGVVCIAEGFATAASVFEATGFACAVAFDCGNLEAVGRSIRATFKEVVILFAADDDSATASNPGVTRANEAAKACNATVVLPPRLSSNADDAGCDFNDVFIEHGPEVVKKAFLLALEEHAHDRPDPHRNAPHLASEGLYGLIGDIARAGSAATEANPSAVALNAMVYLATVVGRIPFMYVGDTLHHVRVFGLHVGRSGIARKGDAASLVHRIGDEVERMKGGIAPQRHRGGLSSREGLVSLIHDGYFEGKNEIEPVLDKRLMVAESEFSNVLHQSKRDGNTLSAAIRDAWDGVDLKPATKTSRMWASKPHVNIVAAITPGELRAMLSAKDRTNGFANRFMTIHAERHQKVPLPKSTSRDVVMSLADRVYQVARFVGIKDGHSVERDDCLEMLLSESAQKLYEELYLTVLSDRSFGEGLASLLERRAPLLLRLGMLFALCDKRLTVEPVHLRAALAWINFWTESVKFVFSASVVEIATEIRNENAAQIVAYLGERGRTSRTALTVDLFNRHIKAEELDAALDELLTATPPVIEVWETREKGRRRGVKEYSLTALPAPAAQPVVDNAPTLGHALAERESSGASSDSSSKHLNLTANRARPNLTADPVVPTDSLNSHSSQSSHGHENPISRDIERI